MTAGPRNVAREMLPHFARLSVLRDVTPSTYAGRAVARRRRQRHIVPMQNVLLPPVTLRRLRRSEMSLFEAHLLRLDADCRRLRFGQAVRDEFLRAYARRKPERGTIIEGAFVDGVLRGVAELRPMALGSRAAEAAVSVEPAFRRRGIGRQLMERLTLRARNHGIRTVVLICLPENVAMRRLAASLGGTVSFAPGEVTYTIPEPAPTVFSLARETMADLSDRLTRLDRWGGPAGRHA
jgi:GNAT superfamily N-acetyltransferase